jgi:hypothetical protein
MGSKLLWLGLTLILAVAQLVPGLPLELLGALVMILGCVLLVLDR